MLQRYWESSEVAY